MIAVISDQCKRGKLLGYVKEVDNHSLKLKTKIEISSLQSKQVGQYTSCDANKLKPSVFIKQDMLQKRTRHTKRKQVIYQ